MIEGKVYFDSHGYPRAEYQPPHEVLGWYLEQDVQNSPATCEELLRLSDEVINGNRPDWQGVGNAHTLSIKGNCVCIENEFSDSGTLCELSIEDFKTALLSWKELVGSVSN